MPPCYGLNVTTNDRICGSQAWIQKVYSRVYDSKSSWPKWMPSITKENPVVELIDERRSGANFILPVIYSWRLCAPLFAVKHEFLDALGPGVVGEYFDLLQMKSEAGGIFPGWTIVIPKPAARVEGKNHAWRANYP